MGNKDALAFLGLTRRAGKLSAGAEDTAESCISGKARLIVTADDMSENTRKWLEQAAEQKGVPIVPIGCLKDELGGALGVGGCACAAVCDTGLAITLCGKLGLEELADGLGFRLAREKRRRAKKLAGKGKADISKRGN